MEPQNLILKRIDLNEIPELINQLYEEGVLKFRFPPGTSKLDELTTREEGLKNLIALTIDIIMKNKKVLQSRKSTTIMGSAIYLACKKLGIKVTYRDLYRLGVTEHALRKTVKLLST